MLAALLPSNGHCGSVQLFEVVGNVKLLWSKFNVFIFVKILDTTREYKDGYLLETLVCYCFTLFSADKVELKIKMVNIMKSVILFIEFECFMMFVWIK